MKLMFSCKECWNFRVAIEYMFVSGYSGEKEWRKISYTSIAGGGENGIICYSGFKGVS
jgi:hypothetical protein